MMLLIAMWATFGVTFAIVVPCYLHSDRVLPNDQAVALGFGIFLLFPLAILATAGYLLVRNVPLLLSGYTGLFRRVFPKKVELPVARVIE